MGDLVRGDVIRRLRKERRWKQQQVVDLLKEQEGSSVVKLRRYQNWEASTPRKPEGIDWENALALAKLFKVEVGEFVYRSADDSAPDLLASLNGKMPKELETRLDAIDQKLETIAKHLGLSDELPAEDVTAEALDAAEQLVAREDEAEPDAGRAPTPHRGQQRRPA